MENTLSKLEIPYCKLGNLSIRNLSLNLMKDYIKLLLAGTSEPELFITFNLNSLKNVQRSKYYDEICRSADLLLPDGIGITSLVNFAHKAKIRRITGNDIFKITLELTEEIEFNIALLGSTEIVLKKTKEKIERQYPKAKISIIISPPLFFEQNKDLNDRIISAVQEAKPDIIFLALGCPRQDIWLYENMKKINSKINVGVGAVFDFFSGEKKRSPAILQNLGLEWFWRLLNEPLRLFRRYIIEDIPLYIYYIIIITFNKIRDRKN